MLYIPGLLYLVLLKGQKHEILDVAHKLRKGQKFETQDFLYMQNTVYNVTRYL